MALLITRVVGKLREKCMFHPGNKYFPGMHPDYKYFPTNQSSWLETCPTPLQKLTGRVGQCGCHSGKNTLEFPNALRKHSSPQNPLILSQLGVNALNLATLGVYSQPRNPLVLSIHFWDTLKCKPDICINDLRYAFFYSNRTYISVQ